MNIGERWEEGILVLNLEGRLTIGDGDVELSSFIDEAFARSEKKIIIDLRGVKKVDSSGLAELLRIRRAATEKETSIKLISDLGSVKNVFEMTRLVGVFDFYDDVMSAIHAMRDEE